ncbi:multiple sugar transport system permease protein [Neorhizobium huautlense]|uniref:Multiple sugar transport system permease protein n=1 Tax=Neorhizobium huautlense TaxID=67774 RepID=A0ABT9PZB7_9HYPH|nr:sugar ABC transporter permease [Neorhizobium huautlense]MDP9839822.1 multiple sugar transport system permease protein [Neorhizobium huautlense]
MAVAQENARAEGRSFSPFWTIARRDSLAGFLFIAPQLVGIIAFVLIPLGLVFWYSLHEWNVLANTFTYTGGQNYRMLIEDESLLEVLGATAIFSAGLVILNMSLALLLAVLLNQKLAGIAIFRTLFFSPVVVSLVAWTIVWGFLLQKNGGINGMLLMLGIEGPNWLREETTAMISVIVVQVFKNVGLNMILFLAALQGVPKELYEAARIDGAPAFKQFRRITLPLISPTILLTSIITIVGSLQVFAQIAVLTQGGPGLSTTVLVYYLYQQAFQFHFFGYGSTLSILLFAIVAILTFAQWQMRKRIVFYES